MAADEEHEREAGNWVENLAETSPMSLEARPGAELSPQDMAVELAICLQLGL